MAFEDGKHYCVSCTSKQKRYVYFKSDVFRCLICGSKLVDREPTGADIARFRSKVERLDGSGKTLCPCCKNVYLVEDFDSCPNCYSADHPDIGVAEISKPKHRVKSRAEVKADFEASLEADPSLLWGDDKAPVTMEPKKIWGTQL